MGCKIRFPYAVQTEPLFYKGSVPKGNTSGAKKGAKRKRLLMEEFNSKLNQMNIYKHFKPAKLYTANGNISKKWYIEYSYKVPGTNTFKRFKEYFDINRIKNTNGKAYAIMYGNEAATFLTEKLESGFNPFLAIKNTENIGFRIIEQLQRLIDTLNTNSTKITQATYKENFNRFAKFIYEYQFEGKLITELTQYHAEEYKTHLQKLKLAPKTINASLSHLGLFWDAAIKNNWAAVNIFRVVKKITKQQNTNTENEKFDPLTQGELIKIFSYFKKNGLQNFNVYLGFIYYAWVRPAEIARLKISDIDLKNSIIKFRKSETKSKKAASIQIVPAFKKLLEEMGLENYNNNDFIFSNCNQLIPGQNPLTKNFTGKIWRKIVKKELGINKDMYALKHTGNIDYLLNNKGNIDLKWQQMQNRHSSSVITDRYNRKLGAYFIETKNLMFQSF